MAEASLAQPSAELHAAQYLSRPRGDNELHAHLLAVTHDVPSSHFVAVSRMAISVVLSFSEAWGVHHGMNTMCSQPPSQDPVGTHHCRILTRAWPGIPCSHQIIQPLSPAWEKPSEKESNHKSSKREVAGGHFKEQVSNTEHCGIQPNGFLSSKCIALPHVNIDRDNTGLGKQDAAKCFPPMETSK